LAIISDNFAPSGAAAKAPTEVAVRRMAASMVRMKNSFDRYNL
jgi:hypothetical protein